MASIQIAIDTPYVTKREFLRRTGMTSSTFDNLRNAGRIPVMDKPSAKSTVLVNLYQVAEQVAYYMATLSSHNVDVKGHSKEDIVGKKVIEALGAVELLAGDNLEELGSLGNMHIVTSGELVTVTGKL